MAIINVPFSFSASAENPSLVTEPLDSAVTKEIFGQLEQRLAIAQRAFLAFHLPASEGVGDSEPVWSVDTDVPSMLMGTWTVQVERYTPTPPAWDDEEVVLEVIFVEGTLRLQDVAAYRGDTGFTKIGTFRDSFLADEHRLAIDEEVRQLKAVLPQFSVEVSSSTPRRPRL